MFEDFEPFESPLLVVQRAEAAIGEIERLCSDFSKSCLYSPVVKLDHQTGDQVVYLRFEKRKPGSINALFSETVNNLRHALDQATCDAARLLGAKSIASVEFPVAGSEQYLDDKIRKKLAGVDQRLVSYLRQFKAHQGGDVTLWALSKLAARKHRTILPLAIDVGPVDYGDLMVIGGRITFMGSEENNWNDERNELKLVIVHPGSEFQFQPSAPVQVLVGDVEVVRGKPVVAALTLFLNKVKSIVAGLEAEARRLAAET